MTVSDAVAQIKLTVNHVTENVGRQVVSRAYRASNELKNAELETLNGEGSGPIRTKPGGGRYHVSLPGEVPARRLGDLRRDWTTQVDPAGSGGDVISLTAYIESSTPYAGFLEHGTSKMARRPYVDKIRQKAMPKVIAIYSEPYV